jgi:hypothetical protein
MSCPPDAKHYALRQQLRAVAGSAPAAIGTSMVGVLATDLIPLLDYIDELEEAQDAAWEASQGEDI